VPPTHIKACRSERAFRNELYIYSSDFQYRPALIEIQQPHSLVLQQVNGIPYLDAEMLSDRLVTQLAQAISGLHAVAQVEGKVLCHWDNQPRNILWDETKQKVILLDFEDIRLAPPEADIAHLFLFWAEALAHNIFTSRVTLFLHKYKPVVPLGSDIWKAELRKARQRFGNRRRKHNKKEPAGNPDRLINRRFLSKLSFPI
jgi:thiamine kinase-like enzyme